MKTSDFFMLENNCSFQLIFDGKIADFDSRFAITYVSNCKIDENIVKL